jgi:hypothetical protein
MAQATSEFLFNSRGFAVTYTDEDVAGEVEPEVWGKMTRAQRTRYLAARADLDAVMYAWEEKIPIVSDFPKRVKQLKKKALDACQVN